MTAEQQLTDLAMAMSYDDVMTLLEHSKRLGTSFDVRAFEALYTSVDAIPEPLLMPLVTHAMAPKKGAMWRGPKDTGAFTLETHNRSYLLKGHVTGGELAGKVTVVAEGVVIHGMFDRGAPDGVWHTDHAFTNTLLSEEKYVDGLRQGVSVYYYDLPTGVPTDGGGAKRYELDYVNNTPVAWRLFHPDGSLEDSGNVVEGEMVRPPQ